MADTIDIERLPVTDRGALLTVAETAATLRISHSSVWRRIRSGELRAVRMGEPGSPVRIPVSAVRAFARDYTTEAT
jgi:excisionase family DNA binding protein